MSLEDEFRKVLDVWYPGADREQFLTDLMAATLTNVVQLPGGGIPEGVEPMKVAETDEAHDERLERADPDYYPVEPTKD